MVRVGLRAKLKASDDGETENYSTSVDICYGNDGKIIPSYCENICT